MKLFIYLDYLVICLVDLCVVEKMVQYMMMDGIFGNLVLCLYCYGWQVEEVVDIVCE